MFKGVGRRLAGRAARLRFTRADWRQMLSELDRRGERRKEAGAFLLSPRGDTSGRISRIIYLDDLDPKCLVGGIHFHSEGYSKLWSICDVDELQVIADIHTHPKGWVGQSSTDRENPMVSRSGHLALIAPNYAAGKISPGDIGVHEYGGEAGWRSHIGREAERLLYVGRFA